jgi:hypothetical protein
MNKLQWTYPFCNMRSQCNLKVEHTPNINYNMYVTEYIILTLTDEINCVDT